MLAGLVVHGLVVHEAPGGDQPAVAVVEAGDDLQLEQVADVAGHGQPAGDLRAVQGEGRPVEPVVEGAGRLRDGAGRRIGGRQPRQRGLTGGRVRPVRRVRAPEASTTDRSSRVVLEASLAELPWRWEPASARPPARRATRNRPRVTFTLLRRVVLRGSRQLPGPGGSARQPPRGARRAGSARDAEGSADDVEQVSVVDAAMERRRGGTVREERHVRAGVVARQVGQPQARVGRAVGDVGRVVRGPEGGGAKFFGSAAPAPLTGPVERAGSLAPLGTRRGGAVGRVARVDVGRRGGWPRRW